MFDPKGLIREAYNIEGIDLVQCRSIFLDWALGLPEASDPRSEVTKLLQHYGADHPDHPMTAILQEGSVQMQVPSGSTGRKGGWRRHR